MQIPNCPLHFFDMDHTLIANDCDVSWKVFLRSQGRVEITDTFWRDFHYSMYRLGRLNVPAFLQYQLRELAGRSPLDMQPLFQQHFKEIVKPRIYPEAKSLLEDLQNQGCCVAILTATCDAISRPLAEYFGVERLIATRCAVSNSLYTGEIEGVYCHGEGKISHAQNFCESKGLQLSAAAFYGDSVSDIPLMEVVGFPVACNPAPELERHANKRNWPILRFELSL